MAQYTGSAQRLTKLSSLGISVTIGSERDNAGVGWIFIVDAYPESPAQAAGLERFDRILEVDGKPLRNMAVADVSHLLRGQAGSTASVVIQRGSERLAASAVRAPIRVVPVEAQICELEGRDQCPNPKFQLGAG